MSDQGQQAMALAMIYPKPEQGGRGKSSAAKTSAKRGGFSMHRVDVAREVLKSSYPKPEEGGKKANVPKFGKVLGEAKKALKQYLFPSNVYLMLVRS
jgi:hypothetical protein